MQKKEKLVPKYTRITKEQSNFIKKFAEKNKMSEGEVFRLAVDSLMRVNKKIM